MNSEAVLRRHYSAPQNSAVLSLKYLKELTDALSGALEAIDTSQSPDVADGISFYEEVKRFEIELIRTALRVTSGSQKRAAELLRLNATTLNSKIKSYNINWRNTYGPSSLPQHTKA